MDVKNELESLKEQLEMFKEQHPNLQVYITVSKEFNDELTKFLGTDEYSIRLMELYGCKYQVSPFVDNYNWIIWLFDYSQILGQWNTFQDEIYKLSHLFSYVTSDAKEKEGSWADSWQTVND